MNTKGIQLFIDQTIYDFQTVAYFLDYGRIKETIPLMEQILTRIHVFQAQVNSSSPEFKNIFAQAIKLPEYSMPMSDQDLQDYQRFIEGTRSWAYGNIYQLRQMIKSPRKKRIEFVFLILSGCVFGFLLASMVFLRSLLEDWGLRGNFYKGQNFEKHILTGYNKTIDFSYYLEMNPLMPREHSSVHWQGFLVAPKNGTYALSLKVDDGARLFIDDHLLIDAWHDNDSVEFTQKIFLSKGEHALRLDYYNHFENSILKLYWSFEGGKREIIPAWYLKHKV